MANSDPPEESLRKPYSSVNVHWWHWVIGATLIALLVIMMPRSKSPEFAHLVEGTVSQVKVIAPFDFEILKSTEELDQERREAAGAVLPVVVRNDSISDLYYRELLHFGTETYASMGELYRSIDSLSNGKIDSLREVPARDRLFAIFGFRLSRSTWDVLIKIFEEDRFQQPGLFFRYFENSLGRVLRNIYGNGIVDVPTAQLSHPTGKINVQYLGEEVTVDSDRFLSYNEAFTRASALLPDVLSAEELPSGSMSAGYEILQAFIVPNILYDQAETDRRKQVAIAKVPLAKGLVKKDELIIDKNYVVKAEHLAKLKSLSVKRKELDLERTGLRAVIPLLGYCCIIIILIIMLSFQILHSRHAVWGDWKLMLLTAILITVSIGSMYLVPLSFDLARYFLPVAVVAMLIAILVDRSVAMASVVFMAVVVGLVKGFDFQIVFINLVAGSAALVGIRRVKNRKDVMQVAVYLWVAIILMVIAFRLSQFSWDARIWTEVALASSNALIAPILVLGLVYFLEKIFRITTDFTLIELVDFNHPLLRELAMKSPGTYHHSIMVGNLAEAAAQVIGADALLTRAGAYYHDIGKVFHKEYFIENQEYGSVNIHDKLPPSTSAKILISHVLDGIKLAEQYKLPKSVIAFITEHHGKSRISYFYSKAYDEQDGNVDEELFRYPGPNPQSKETGILMLADIVEAATRVSNAKTPEELDVVIGELIKHRIAEGDLDECPLTIRELDMIRMTFTNVIANALHARIPYPKEKKKEVEKSNLDKKLEDDSQKDV